MLSKSLGWQMTRMNSNGSANLTGNTRVTGDNKTDEKGRGDTFKHFGYGSTIYAFELGAVLLQNSTFHDEAELISKYMGYQSCQPGLVPGRRLAGHQARQPVQADFSNFSLA